MWISLTRDDVRRAEADLKSQRAEMEARHSRELEDLQSQHAEERSQLEAKLSQIAEVERAIEAFVHEYVHTTNSGAMPEGDQKEAQPAETELAQHLTVPAEVEVVATNWGNARFAPAQDTHGSKLAREWGE
jgi:hypothetical protein